MKKSILIIWFQIGFLSGFTINLFWPSRKTTHDYVLPQICSGETALTCGACGQEIVCSSCNFKLAKD